MAARLDGWRARLQRPLPYPALQQGQTALLSVMWCSLLVAMAIVASALHRYSPTQAPLFWAVWVVLVPADLFLPSHKAPLWVRLPYVATELGLVLVLCWLGGFEVGSYVLFAVVAHGYILGIPGSIAFLGLVFAGRYATILFNPRDAGSPLDSDISWAIGATFVVVAFTAMFKAIEQRDRNVELVAVVQDQARELEREALEDALTGLHNRRFLEIDLPREFERQRRFGRPFTLAMVDTDDFKLVNDRHSHQVGDAVLRELAGIMRATCRTVDGIVRYGGEEFALYFPETTLAEGEGACERLRGAVEAHDWTAIAPGLKVTVTIGVAASTANGSVRELIAVADDRLLAAKRSGKNRVLGGAHT
ncbi:MAG: GGDEF domain-containing protein [Chloroflexi bacterium]|nr:GGDEF domain-containing protein [Chloroflexota bacterium]